MRPGGRGRRRCCGAIEMRHGSPETAYHLLLEAARDLAADDPAAALDALVLAGEAATFLGDPRLTLEVSDLATALRASGAAVDDSVVDLLVGLGKLFEGNWSEGSRILAGVVDESVASAEYDDVLRSGRAAMYLGRLDDARDPVRTGGGPRPDQRQRRPARADARPTGLHRAAARSAAGRRDARAGRTAAVPATSASTPAWLWRAWRRCTPTGGSEAECRAQAALAMEVAATRQLKMVSAGAQWAIGLLELGAGRPAEALVALESVASSDRRPPRHPALGHARPGGGRCPHRDDRRPAQQAVARLQAWAEASGLPIPAAALARCRGLLTSGEEAIGHFEDALRADDRDTRPLERARIQLLLGETLRRSRQRAESRDTPARRHGDLRAAAARNPGRTGPAASCARPARAPPDATSATREHLTPQELQIAQYAADGDSNADDRSQAVPQPPYRRVPPRQGLHEDRRHLPPTAGRHRPFSR